MKQTENNEMDLLLRDLARREGARSVQAGDDSAGHMDADELNSYAEQVLPAAARARYTSHLADCASCRKSVLELTSAAGTRVSELLVPQKTSSGLREKLAALFSFSVLRYAVPALALFAFVAIGLIALRQQPESDFVAKNQPLATPETGTALKQAEPSAAPANSSGVIEERPAEGLTSAGKAGDNQPKAGEVNETVTDSTTVQDEKDAPAKAAGAVAQPSYAPEPAAPPPAKPQPTQVETRTEVTAREKEADKKNEPPRDQQVARARTDDSQNQVGAAQSRTTSVDGRQDSLSKLEAKRSSAPGAKAKDDDAETRTVSGRRFRRQGSIWIDTAYKTSSATTALSRGSEQFRALVADEPGIRAIADQLDGEVVVVWKGRAYRIR